MKKMWLIFTVLVSSLPLQMALSKEIKKPAAVKYTPDAKAGTSNPEVFAQLGHSQHITKIIYSPDGKTYATASATEGVIKIWDIASNREIRTLNARFQWVNDIAFSPDGKTIASAHGQDGIVLWDAGKGEKVVHLTANGSSGMPQSYDALGFAADGKSLVAAGNATVLWDLTTKQIVKIFGDNNMVSAMAMSTDGKTLATIQLSTSFFKSVSSLTLWDVSSGKSLRTISLGDIGIGKIAFSPDGKFVAVGHAADESVRAWEVASGTLKKTFQGTNGGVHALAFSPDGKYLLVGGGFNTKTEKFSEGAKLTLWDWESAKQLAAFSDNPTGHDTVAFSNDGATIASDLELSLSFLKVRDMLNTSGNIGIVANQGPTNPAGSGSSPESSNAGYINETTLAVSPQGLLATAAATSDKITLRDIKTGKEVATLLAGETSSIQHLEFSADGAVLVALGEATDAKPNKGGNVIHVFDVRSRKEVQQFIIGQSYSETEFISSLAISPDAKLFAYTTDDFTKSLARIESGYKIELESNRIHLLNLEDGKELKTFKGEGGEVSFLDFAADGQSLLYSCHNSKPSRSDGGVYALNTRTGKPLWGITNDIYFSGFAKFSHDGKTIAIRDNTSLKLVDAATGKVLRAIKDVPKTAHRLSTLTFTSDDKTLVAGFENDKIHFWDTTSGELLYRLEGQAGTVNKLFILGANDGLVSASTQTVNARGLGMSKGNGASKLWDIKKRQEVASFVYFNDGGHLIQTPQGYFAASSPQAAANLNVRKNGQVYSIDQFYDVFYRPDIVEAALSGKDISGMMALTIDEAARNTPPTIEKVEVPATSAADKVKVTYRIKSTGGGIGDVRVFHNGKLVQSDGGAHNAPNSLFGKKVSQITGEVIATQLRGLVTESGKGAKRKGVVTAHAKPDLYKATIEIEPIPGENEIAVVAFNAQNSVQSVANTVKFVSSKPEVAPRLFMLAVGIDEYKDNSSNLKYAVKDSRDIVARWKAQATNIYGDKSIFVETINNAQAGRKGILAKINQIAAKVKPTDHFLLFVASHGVLLGEQYYMVTNDYDGELQPSKMISANEIVEFSKRIKALSQLYILDTCHAGGMEGVVSGLYDARVSVLAKKMGLHVFASASSAEEALDGFEGNGLFTHTLLSGLNNNKQADKNTDRQVSLTELGSYSKVQTRDIATKLKHKQDPLIINFGQDNAVYRLQ